jgi:uncharacterized protein (DUF2062 family)
MIHRGRLFFSQIMEEREGRLTTSPSAVGSAIGLSVRPAINLRILLTIHLAILLTIQLPVLTAIGLPIFLPVLLPILLPVGPAIFLPDIHLAEGLTWDVKTSDGCRRGNDQPGDDPDFRQ